MGKCLVCGKESRLVSSWLGVCRDCLLSRSNDALAIVRARRRKWRAKLGLPPEPPRFKSGIRCGICVNECLIPPGDRGYCGIWYNRNGILNHIAGKDLLVGFTYLDPLPTNCVATPVCPAATSRGYPVYTDSPGPETGYYNLAVFLGGCPLDCAFCQNPEHKYMISGGRVDSKNMLTLNELIRRALDPKVRCICYFGGDPTPHAPLLIIASRKIIAQARRESQRIKRICWETDGLVSPGLMKAMAKISLESGGIVKIDWKAWSPQIYEVLTGVDGYRAVERLKVNVRIVSSLGRYRGDPPLLVVSTLLVPGYVTPKEVYHIASFLAELDPVPPLVLLAFYPTHRMPDLPPTSRDHMEKALEAAYSAGLKEVYVGNEWLLGDSYKCNSF